MRLLRFHVTAGAQVSLLQGRARCHRPGQALQIGDAGARIIQSAMTSSRFLGDRHSERYVAGIRTRSFGEPDPGEPALVLLPGLGAGLEFVDPIARAVSSDCHRVCMDIPGFGLTKKTSPASIPEIVNSLDEALVALGVEEAIVIGQSLGGIIGLAWCTQSSRIRGVCLVNGEQRSLIESIARPARAVRQGCLSRLLFALWIVLAAIFRMPDTFRRHLLRLRYLRQASLWPYLKYPKQVDPDDLSARLSNSGSATTLRLILQARRFDFGNLAAGCRVPIAVIGSDGDRFTTADDEDWYRTHFNVVIEIEVADAGHWSMIDQPESFASKLNLAIETLISELPG